MALSLSRYVNVRRAERPRLSWLYGMLFVSVVGCVWGEAVIEAGFLREVGVQYLPLAIAASAVLSMGSITVYNLFADRSANHKLLIAILVLSLLGIGTGVLLLAGGWVALAFPLLYVVDAVLVRDLLNVHWPIYVNGFFDTQSAKRIFPVLSSASRVAAIIGGLTMPLLNRTISTTAIVAMMLVTQFAMLALAVLMRRALRDRTGAAIGAPARGRTDRRSDAWTSIEEGYRYVTGSRYLRWIAGATLLTMVLLAYLNYESGRLLLADLKTVQAMSNFTALLRALGNVVALPIQLFLLSRIIRRIGVGNANLIYPSTSLAAVACLTLAPGLLTAAFGYLTRVVLRNTFYIPVDSLLYNAVPLRMKARARGFISGYVMTAGSLAGGLLLIFNTQLAGPFLAVFFGALSLAYLGSALEVRRYYGKAVIAMLADDDYASVLAPTDLAPPDAEVPAVDDATLNRLAARLAGADASPEQKVFMAQVVCQVGDARALPILEAAIREAPDGRLRARLLKVLAASSSGSAAAEAIYVSCLSDHEKEVREAALAGLEECTGDDKRRFQPLAAPLLADEEPDVRAAALAALVRQGAFYVEPAAGPVLETLLRSDNPQARALGVRLLGRLIETPEQIANRTAAAEALTSRLVAALSDPADVVRLAAAVATEEAAGTSADLLPEWLPAGALGRMLADPIERVRLVAAGLLGRGGGPEARALLVEALADGSTAVRSAAVEGLVRSGPTSVDLVRPLLTSENTRLRCATGAIAARVEPARYASSLLSWCVAGPLQVAYRYWGHRIALEASSPSPASSVLQCGLSEQIAQRVEDVFYLIRAIRPAQSVDMAAASLRSRDPLARANGREALEVLTTSQIAQLLSPLCEEAPSHGKLLALGRLTWGWPASSADQAIQELIANREDPWLSGLAAAAAGAYWAGAGRQEGNMLSAIEKVIFLKEVPFFQGMTVEQLRVLANVCEEEFFPADARLFNEGDPGGALYVVVSGRVAIEQAKRPGSVARIATVEAHSYLGEADFFDNNCRTNSASAIQDTLTLKLRREPVVALARQHPDLSLELINVLSERLREANNRIAELTRAHPQKLHKLYDQLG